MPYFEGSQNVRVERSSMIDVEGNHTHNNHNSRVTNKGSGNTTTYNVTDSYNDSSQRYIRNRITYNTYGYDHPEHHAAMEGGTCGGPTGRRPFQPPCDIPGLNRAYTASATEESIHGQPEWGQPWPVPQCEPELDSDDEGVSHDDERPYYEGSFHSSAIPSWIHQVPSSSAPYHSTGTPPSSRQNNPFAGLSNPPKSNSSPSGYFPSNQSIMNEGGSAQADYCCLRSN